VAKLQPAQWIALNHSRAATSAKQHLTQMLILSTIKQSACAG